VLWFRIQQLAGQRGGTGAFCPGWSHQPGLKALHLSWLVAPTGTNTKGSLFCPGWWISWGNGPAHEAKWTECKGPRAQNINFVLLRRPRQIAASTLLYILLTQGVKGAPLSTCSHFVGLRISLPFSTVWWSLSPTVWCPPVGSFYHNPRVFVSIGSSSIDNTGSGSSALAPVGGASTQALCDRTAKLKRLIKCNGHHLNISDALA